MEVNPIIKEVVPCGANSFLKGIPRIGKDMSPWKANRKSRVVSPFVSIVASRLHFGKTNVVQRSKQEITKVVPLCNYNGETWTLATDST